MQSTINGDLHGPGIVVAALALWFVRRADRLRVASRVAGLITACVLAAFVAQRRLRR